MTRSRLALIASLTIVSVAASSSLVPASAAAQPAQDPVKDVARQRYQDGVKAFDAGRYEEAREAFAQAYALTAVPAVLLNLGLAEAKTNRCVEGGNHLVKFLREHKDAKENEKTTAGAAIEECKKKVSLITVNADVAGADITVDGTSVGKSPLPDSIFVEPGAHTVVGTLPGKSASSSIDAKKGQAAVATLVLKTPAPVPDPGPRPDPVLIPQPIPDPGNPDPPGQNPQPLPPDTSGREDFGSWVTSTRGVPFWIGSGVFVVGLGLGAGFASAASQSAEDVQTKADNIENLLDEGDDDPPCGPEDSDGSQDRSDFGARCNDLRAAIDIHNANVAVMGVGWALAGAGAIGTVIYTMVDWYGSKSSDERAGPAVTVLPMVSPDMRGLTVLGKF